MFPAEAIHSDSHIGADTATFPYLHSRSFAEGITEGLCGIDQILRIHRNGVICRIFHFADLTAHYYHLSQLR